MINKHLKKFILLLAITCVLSFLPSRSSAITFTSTYTEDPVSFMLTVIASDFDASGSKTAPPFDVGGPDTDWDVSLTLSFLAGADDLFFLTGSFEHKLGTGPIFTLMSGPITASGLGMGTHSISLGPSFDPASIQSHGSVFDILSGDLTITIGAGDQITALSATIKGVHTPEPGTVMLLGAGLLGLGLAGRIRQKLGGANLNKS